MKDVEELCARGTVLRCVHYTTSWISNWAGLLLSPPLSKLEWNSNPCKLYLWLCKAATGLNSCWAATATTTCCFDRVSILHSISWMSRRRCLHYFGKSWNAFAEGYAGYTAKKGCRLPTGFQLWNDLGQMLLSSLVIRAWLVFGLPLSRQLRVPNLLQGSKTCHGDYPFSIKTAWEKTN